MTTATSRRRSAYPTSQKQSDGTTNGHYASGTNHAPLTNSRAYVVPPWTIFRNRERLPVLRLEPDSGGAFVGFGASQRPHLVSEFVGGAALFSPEGGVR